MNDTRSTFSVLITALIITLAGYVKPDELHSELSVQKRDKFKEGWYFCLYGGT
jgi:hypothetical protein